MSDVDFRLPQRLEVNVCKITAKFPLSLCKFHKYLLLLCGYGHLQQLAYITSKSWLSDEFSITSKFQFVLILLESYSTIFEVLSSTIINVQSNEVRGFSNYKKS